MHELQDPNSYIKACNKKEKKNDLQKCRVSLRKSLQNFSIKGIRYITSI